MDSGYGDERQTRHLGVRTEPRRALGLISSIAVQFSLIAVAGNLFLGFGYGITTSGPAFLWAWVLGGVLQISVGLSISEMASAYPIVGSCYTWIRRLWATLPAWMAGYLLIVAYITATAEIDHLAAPYILQIAGVAVPTLAQSTAVACICLVIQTLVNLGGVRVLAIIGGISATIQIIGVSMLLTVLAILGLQQAPTILFNATGTAAHEHVPPFALVLLLPIWLITNLDSVANMAEEIRKPEQNIPRGLTIANLASVICGTALIAGTLLTMTDLGEATRAPIPLLSIMQNRLGISLATGFEILLIATLCAAPAMLQAIAARLLWALARDGALPGARVIYRLNRHGAPGHGIVFCAAVATLLLLWSQGLYILDLVGAEALAIPYTVTIAVGLRAKLKGTLPRDRAWNLGRWSVANDILALLWSAVVILLLPLSDPTNTIGGVLIIVAIGLLLYATLVRPRRILSHRQEPQTINRL